MTTVRGPIILCALALAATTSIMACSDGGSDSERIRTQEDSLFLGYWLGMPRDSFYAHSWALNRKGLIMQGPRNQHIKLSLDTTFAHPATLLFYPDFFDGKIARMRMRFSYDGWAPWNKFLFADTMIVDIVELMQAWYGEGFGSRPVQGPFGRIVPQYTNMGQARRISIQVLDDREVGVLITDLGAERRMAEETDTDVPD